MPFTDFSGRTWKTYLVQWRFAPGEYRTVGHYEAPNAKAALRMARREHRERYGNGAEDKRYMKSMRVARNPGRKKKKKSAHKRMGAALSSWLKKQNPGKMKGVTRVRVKRLKGGGVTITPVR